MTTLPCASLSLTGLSPLSSAVKSGADWPGLSSGPPSVVGLPRSVTAPFRSSAIGYPPGEILVHSSIGHDSGGRVVHGPGRRGRSSGARAAVRRRRRSLVDPAPLAPGVRERHADLAADRNSRGRGAGARALPRARSRRERREHRDGSAAGGRRALRDAAALAQRPP